MKQQEFENIIKKYGEIQNFARTEKRLNAVLTKLEEVKTILLRLDSFKEFSSRIELFKEQYWMLKEYFTIEEAATFIGVSYSHLYDYIKESKFPVYILDLEEKTLIKRDELIAWIEKNRIMSEEEIEENTQVILEQMRKRHVRNLVNRALRNQQNRKDENKNQKRNKK